MVYKFAQFFNDKRKDRGLTIRAMASKLNLSASYICDIEQSRKIAPYSEETKDFYNDLKVILNLNAEEIKEMNEAVEEDLSTKGKLSQDLTNYVTSNDDIRMAFREIKDLNPTAEELNEAIKAMRDKMKSTRPIYSHEKIEEISVELLKKYPQFLLETKPIDIDYIIENEGYTIQSLAFASRGILGAAIFKDTSIDVIDSYTQEISPCFVQKDSIVYDELEGDKSEFRLRTTLAHELGHMVLHKKIYCSNENSVLCKREVIERESEPRNLITKNDWEEHQANYFASCILIPKVLLIRIVNDSVKKYECPIPSKMKFMSFDEKEMLVEKISKTLDVSKAMARIRFHNVYL